MIRLKAISKPVKMMMFHFNFYPIMKKSTKILLEIIKVIVSVLLGYGAGANDVINSML